MEDIVPTLKTPLPPDTDQFLLVMTATVRPSDAAQVRRSDPAERLRDYEHALRFWLNYRHEVAGRILLLENSASDLTPLRRIAEKDNPFLKQVEILSVEGNRIPPGLNYGYAEMKMLDDGLALSQLRRETTHMVKVTGRLTFPACGKALDMVERPLEAIIDCRKLGFPRRGYDANTQILYFSHAFYDRVLRNSCEEMNTTDLRLLEHLIYRKVSACKGQPGVHLRLPCNVDPIGVSGFTGRPYSSLALRAEQALRGALRTVLPNFWF